MSVMLCEVNESEKVAQFTAWLKDNGAIYPKIEWPSENTESGVRGAVALENIESHEFMLQIPTHMIMCPPTIFSDHDVGKILHNNLDLLHGDLLLAVYIMHEVRKKKHSFYYPYLQIVPAPFNISEWSTEELKEFQHDELLARSRSRQQMIKRMYDKTIIGLNERHPESFPLSEFSFDLFKFAWNSIQARAFGRRLPWTAMVPFADCLNHSNVQTKYDYNVDDNGLFRLFPSGANCYCAGKEVFNSYGRRPNDNLLLDYGFAILDNEWDEVELSLGMPDDEPNKALKSRILLAEGISSHRRYRLRPGEVPLEALTFLRIVSLSAESIMAVDAAEQRARATLREDFVEASDLYHCSDKEDGLPPIRHSSGYDLPLSAQSERRCLQLLRDILGSMVRSRETSVQQDQQLLADLKALRGATEELLTLPSERDKASVSVRYDSEQYWKLVNCLHYRITRKLIVDSVIESTDALLATISAGSLFSGQVDQVCTSLTDMQRYVSGNKRYKSKFEQYFKSICDEKAWVLR